jgi:multisubunit Na+/H+ antiporter MnhB subunit
MYIAIHVIIAVSTLVYTTYLYYYPSPKKFNPAYWLLGFTLASGTLLIFISGANILRTCLTGLLYIGVVSAVIIAAKHKLASQERNID